MSVTYCVVEGCSSKLGEGLSFFRCPLYKDRCLAWKNALGFTGTHKYADITLEQSHNRIRVCSLHFSENSFANIAKNRLNKFAIPSLHLRVNSALGGGSSGCEMPTAGRNYAFTQTEIETENVGQSQNLDKKGTKADTSVQASLTALSQSDACVQTDSCYCTDSSNVSVDLLTENPSGELSCGKRKGIIAYRINKFQKLDSGTTIAASEPSTSAATRPSNELESIYFKEEPLETVQEECQLEVKIENDEFTEGSFVEPLVYPAVSSATDALDDTSKLDSAAYIEQIIESKSDLVTLFHKLSQLAKGMNPLDQAVFQNKVSNAVFQMKIQQLSKTN